MVAQFFLVLKDYLIEVLPFLAVGFLLSGLIHEFIPAGWVERHLGGKGIKPLLYSTLVGTALPICCIGALPVAVSLHQKGARLGPVLAFLVATPATSVTALLVCYGLILGGQVRGTILVLRKEFGGKTLLIYLTVISVVALALGYCFSIIG